MTQLRDLNINMETQYSEIKKSRTQWLKNSKLITQRHHSFEEYSTHRVHMRPTPAIMERLKWSHLNTRVIIVIISKLINQRQMIVPNTLEVNHICSQHIIQGLNSPFSLIICLWMKIVLSLTWLPRCFWNDLQNWEVN